MRFRKQLISGIAVQIALMLIVCAVAIITPDRITRDASHETQKTLDEVVGVHELHTAIERLVASSRAYLITGNPTYLEKVNVVRRALDDRLAALQREPRAAAELAAVERQLQAYTSAVDDVVSRRDRVNDLAALERLFERRLAPLREPLDVAIARLEQTNSELLGNRMSQHERLSATAALTVLLASLIAIALSIVVGTIMIRRLSSQYREIQRATEAANEAAGKRKELLDMVSHDLRSPLSTIVLGTEMLRDEHPDLPHIAALGNAAQRMQRLVDDLLDTARAETCGLDLDLSTHDVQKLLELAVELFAVRAERAGIDLRIDHRTDATVVADRDRILQILANLIANALKVTPRGGAIVLAADATPDGVLFSVRDSGPGLDGANIPDLFEAYHQGATGSWRRGSLGLGLYIAKTLTHAHGGRIGVESDEQEGSKFWFELPRDASRIHA